MGDGKRAAASIDAWLTGEWPPAVDVSEAAVAAAAEA
jgi:hypothetical protein